jgi:hypothetical protein
MVQKIWYASDEDRTALTGLDCEGIEQYPCEAAWNQLAIPMTIGVVCDQTCLCCPGIHEPGKRRCATLYVRSSLHYPTKRRPVE